MRGEFQKFPFSFLIQPIPIHPKAKQLFFKWDGIYFLLLSLYWFSECFFYFIMTRFRLILPVHSHNVTKDLTGHRMHVEGPKIRPIAFRIYMTCYRWKSTVLPRKLFVPQKTPKNSLFRRQGIRGILTSGGAVCQNRSTIRVPLKSLGYKGSN